MKTLRLVFVALLTAFVRLENVLFFFFFLIFINVEVLRVVAVALWRKKRWAWIIGVGVAPAILIALMMGEMVDELGEALDTHRQEMPDGVTHHFKEILADQQCRLRRTREGKHGESVQTNRDDSHAAYA